jgi:hypothetical protein
MDPSDREIRAERDRYRKELKARELWDLTEP